VSDTITRLQAVQIYIGTISNFALGRGVRSVDAEAQRTLDDAIAEFQRLRADNEQMNVVILKWIEANNAASTLINEQQAEIKQLRAKVRQLEHDLHPPCNCPHCTGLPDYYADEAALDAAGEE